jgi:phage protein D
MHVTLDQYQWESGTAATLGDVLAEVSERAQVRSRIVTSLELDRRAITDRDLDAAFLGEPAEKYARLTAVSQSTQEVMRSAQHSAGRYAHLLHVEGSALAGAFRSGQFQVNTLDLWLGKLADYLELVEGVGTLRGAGRDAKPLSTWVGDLLDARTGQDAVLMADLLEYEILPRLEPSQPSEGRS